MTYRELLNRIIQLNEEQLEQTATVFDAYTLEYIPIVDVKLTEEDDVLDAKHPVMVLKA